MKSIKLTFDIKRCWSSLKFGIPLVPHSIAHWSLINIDRLILLQYLSVFQVGIYSLGYQIGGILGTMVISFNSAWSPYYYRTAAENKEAPLIFAKFVLPYITILCSSGLVISFFAGNLLMFLAPNTFQGAAKIVPIIAASQILLGIYSYMAGAIFFKKKSNVIFILSISSAVVNVLLNILLIPLLGVMGAALATLGGYCFLCIVVFVAAQNIYHIPYHKKAIITLLGVCFLLLLFDNFLQYQGVLAAVVLKLTMLILFLTLAWKKGAFCVKTSSAGG